ncbi:pyridoxamine 5'-phosphate oxidase family protein [Streptomyces sp. NPDC005813]|uniref:helix-turn-helix domain-containing protein n=1 Tax=Streptomyces sp. NPDC005813 TaxID=3155592 RepID=UPI0033C5AA6A
MTGQVRTNTVEAPPLGDLGRRLVARRAELGLTCEEAAARAGVAPNYLRYLEERPGAAPGAGTLLRLAEALRTTMSHLTGGDSDRPPGPGQAGRSPDLTELSPSECRTLLSDHGVGRVAVLTATGPAVVPVNYGVVDDAIVFRTSPGATPALAAGSEVAFEVDRIDDAFSEGWSVLVRGHGRAVTDEEEARRLTGLARSEPWAGGRRELWVRIDVRTVTGRRITV